MQQEPPATKPPSPVRTQPPPATDIDVTDIPISVMEVNMEVSPRSQEQFPDLADFEPDQTISAAATASAAAPEDPPVATDSATAREVSAPAPNATVFGTQVPDSSITPSPKPSTPQTHRPNPPDQPKPALCQAVPR